MNLFHSAKYFLQRRAALIAIFFLAANHLVGVVGLNTPQRLVFEKFSWVNLLLSLLVVIVFQKPFEKKMLSFVTFTFVLGMLVEILGVSTGYPFGTYYYTEKFGMQVFGVPLVIGLNWVLLSYCSSIAMQPYFSNDWLKIIGASALMLALDVLLEPFAIRHTFWVWKDGAPPLQNFLTWFVVSLPIQWVFAVLMKGNTNKISTTYLLVLVAFLIADLLLSL